MRLARPRLAVSACLLGQAVRYDGGHKAHPFITGPLAAWAELLPVCPEVAIGLGVPRPPIQLVGDPERPRLLGVADPRLDLTERMAACARDWTRDLEGLAGAVLKQGSPSCGPARVKVYPEPEGAPLLVGQGLWARAIRDRDPLFPLAAEDQLEDPAQRERFLVRVWVRHQWQRLLARGPTRPRLQRFHTRHRHWVLARNPAAGRRLDQLMADPDPVDREGVPASYGQVLFQGLADPPAGDV